MNEKKRKRLESAGWKLGNASDFLNLTESETNLVETKVRLALLAKNKKK